VDVTPRCATARAVFQAPSVNSATQAKSQAVKSMSWVAYSKSCMLHRPDGVGFGGGEFTVRHAATLRRQPRRVQARRPWRDRRLERDQRRASSHRLSESEIHPRPGHRAQPRHQSRQYAARPNKRAIIESSWISFGSFARYGVRHGRASLPSPPRGKVRQFWNFSLRIGTTPQGG
jgi:hypothetical protein